jgi:predicted O-methyltransferase YrrM
MLEVGSLVGYSTILMGKELEGDAEIITIDIDKDAAELARENIRNAAVKPRVTVLAGDALEIIPKLDGKFDLVFLDAAKNEYLDYLRLLEGDLHEGSVVVADNAGAYAHSMRRYLDYVRNSGKYESRFIPSSGDGIEVSIRL